MSVTVKPAANVFLEPGVNVTEIVQLPPPAREFGHALACVKSAAFVPVIAIFEIFNSVAPVLVRVTVFVVLLFIGSVPKFRLIGWKLA